MQFAFKFIGGPLDGDGLVGDTEQPTTRPDFAGQALQDTEGGTVGKRFEIINPRQPVAEQDTIWVRKKYIYQVTERRPSRRGKMLISAKYIGPAVPAEGDGRS